MCCMNRQLLALEIGCCPYISSRKNYYYFGLIFIAMLFHTNVSSICSLLFFNRRIHNYILGFYCYLFSIGRTYSYLSNFSLGGGINEFAADKPESIFNRQKKCQCWSFHNRFVSKNRLPYTILATRKLYFKKM
jgi:hypothetical protein